MKFFAAVVCVAFFTSFIDARLPSPQDWTDDDFERLLYEEELDGEERFIGSAFNAAKNAASAAANTIENAASTTAEATVSTVNLVKDTTVNAAAKAGQAGVNLVKYISEASTGAAIDALLFNTKLFLKATNKENIVLPEIEKKFTGVNFNTSEGYFRTLKNLTRSGKANLSMDGLTLIVSFPLTITGLEVGYPNYTAKALFMSTKGDFEVNVENNTIQITLAITPGLTCQMNVREVEVTVLEGIKLKFNGLCNLCAKVVEKAGTALANYLKETIKAKVESSINEAIENALENNPLICAQFLGTGED